MRATQFPWLWVKLRSVKYSSCGCDVKFLQVHFVRRFEMFFNLFRTINHLSLWVILPRTLYNSQSHCHSRKLRGCKLRGCKLAMLKGNVQVYIRALSIFLTSEIQFVDDHLNFLNRKWCKNKSITSHRSQRLDCNFPTIQVTHRFKLLLTNYIDANLYGNYTRLQCFAWFVVVVVVFYSYQGSAC